MPSALESQRNGASHDDLDNYDVGNLSDDPFASPQGSPRSKRKVDESGLGIEEEVSVQKRARVPRVKLDDERLLSEKGIPMLKKRAQKLKFKGKGHEFSDTARLLEFFQLWLDDLFPKARFIDALKMVEKAGHKKRLVAARDGWLHENRPKVTADDDDILFPENTADRQPTPPVDNDVPTNEDLDDAIPRSRPPVTGRLVQLNNPPDEDGLDALMAEAETTDRRPADDEEDGLDALIAEAESRDKRDENAETNGNSTAKEKEQADFADEEEAMREMDDLW